MQKIILSIALSSALFAASDCEKVTEKIDAQIEKAQAAKTPNEAKIAYLNGQKEQILAACEDGKIDSTKLAEIKSKTKYDYENAQIAEKAAKIEAKKAQIQAKHDAEMAKIEAKKAKAEEKARLKAEKQAAKEAKKAEKAAAKAAKKEAKAAEKTAK